MLTPETPQPHISIADLAVYYPVDTEFVFTIVANYTNSFDNVLLAINTRKLDSTSEHTYIIFQPGNKPWRKFNPQPNTSYVATIRKNKHDSLFIEPLSEYILTSASSVGNSATQTITHYRDLPFTERTRVNCLISDTSVEFPSMLINPVGTTEVYRVNVPRSIARANIAALDRKILVISVKHNTHKSRLKIHDITEFTVSSNLSSVILSADVKRISSATHSTTATVPSVIEPAPGDTWELKRDSSVRVVIDSTEPLTKSSLIWYDTTKYSVLKEFLEHYTISIQPLPWWKTIPESGYLCTSSKTGRFHIVYSGGADNYYTQYAPVTLSEVPLSLYYNPPSPSDPVDEDEIPF